MEEAFSRAASVSSTVSRTVVWKELSAPPAPMAIAVVGQAQSTRQNRNMRMGLCFLTGVGIRLTGLAVNNVVTLHAGAVPLLYIIPLAAIGISLFLIVRGARARKLNPRIERIADAAGVVLAGLRQRFTRALPASTRPAGS